MKLLIIVITLEERPEASPKKSGAYATSFEAQHVAHRTKRNTHVDLLVLAADQAPAPGIAAEVVPDERIN